MSESSAPHAPSSIPTQTPSPPAAPHALPVALLQSLRPRQWTKNLFLFAGLLFTLDKPHTADDYVHAGLAFVVFCALSGCVYLLNDITDIAADRRHPKKRWRPIASGRLPVPVARIAALTLLPAALLVAWGINGWFFAATFTYFAITLLYSLWLKHVVLVDVMVIAAGFVLRAAAGALAIRVGISEWLLMCTVLLALFLGFTKRRGELVALGDSPATRKILADYSIPLLDQMITIVAAACLMAYSLYAFFSATGRGKPYLMATIPFVVYGLFRYLYLAQRRGIGEAPETALLEDRPLLINIALWIATAVAAILLGRS